MKDMTLSFIGYPPKFVNTIPISYLIYQSCTENINPVMLQCLHLWVLYKLIITVRGMIWKHYAAYYSLFNIFSRLWRRFPQGMQFQEYSKLPGKPQAILVITVLCNRDDFCKNAFQMFHLSNHIILLGKIMGVKA